MQLVTLFDISIIAIKCITNQGQKMMMVENYMMDTLEDDEISYSEQELDAMYLEYQERVVKKYELKILLKKAGVL